MGEWVLSTFTGKLIFGGSFEAREVTENQFPKKFQKIRYPVKLLKANAFRNSLEKRFAVAWGLDAQDCHGGGFGCIGGFAQRSC